MRGGPAPCYLRRCNANACRSAAPVRARLSGRGRGLAPVARSASPRGCKRLLRAARPRHGAAAYGHSGRLVSGRGPAAVAGVPEAAGAAGGGRLLHGRAAGAVHGGAPPRRGKRTGGAGRRPRHRRCRVTRRARRPRRGGLLPLRPGARAAPAPAGGPAQRPLRRGRRGPAAAVGCHRLAGRDGCRRRRAPHQGRRPGGGPAPGRRRVRPPRRRRAPGEGPARLAGRSGRGGHPRLRAARRRGGDSRLHGGAARHAPARPGGRRDPPRRHAGHPRRGPDDDARRQGAGVSGGNSLRPGGRPRAAAGRRWRHGS